MCQHDFEASDTTFEQRLIDDTSFCSRCFKDIMNDKYDDELTYNLSTVKV
jgi:hypothetical protein